MRARFSEADLARIRDATHDAEQRTSGEIVPYLVNRVDPYPEASWRGMALGALLAALGTGLLGGLGIVWSGHPDTIASGLIDVTLPILAGGAVGYLLAHWPPIARLLIDDEVLARRVRLRAEAAFLEEEVFHTRERTGILIFLALFERRAVILADEGIHRAVPKDTWEEVVAELVAGIRAGRASDALCQAIERSGEILASHRVERRPDDRDELADGLRIRES